MKTIYILTKLYSDGQSVPIKAFDSETSANARCFKLNQTPVSWNKFRFIVQSVELEEEEYHGYYGFYSEEAAKNFGYVIYTQGDEKVKVTSVDKNPLAPSYLWKDKVCVGKVDKFVENRQNHKFY